MKFEPSKCLLYGNILWIFGLAVIFAGYPQWAWVPINMAGFAFGYRAAIKDYALPNGDR